MGWLTCFVALTAAMTVLTIPALRPSIKANAFTWPALRVGDRLITVFVICTCAVASIYGLVLLAAKVLS